MRIFVTGATGFVGAAIVRELLSAGHQVLGLARSDAAAAALEARGVQAQRGSVEDIESSRRGASRADAIVHAGFNHDFTRFQASCEDDARAIEAMGAVFEGSPRPLVITSAVGTLPKGRLVDESAIAVAAHPRSSRSRPALALATTRWLKRASPCATSPRSSDFVSTYL